MKNYRYSVFVFISIFLATAVSAKHSTRISIHGKIDKTIIEQFNAVAVNVYIYNDYFISSPTNDNLFTATLDSAGQFSFSITNVPNGLFHLALEIGSKDQLQHPPIHGSYIVPRARELYLAENGDSIHIQVYKNNFMKFTGQGSDKYNCLHQLYQTRITSEGLGNRHIALSNAKEYHSAYLMDEAIYYLTIKAREELLKTYQGRFSPEIYDLIHLDAIASVLYQPILSSSWAYNFANSEYTVPEARDFLYKFRNKDLTGAIDSSRMAESAYYADLLLQSEIRTFRFNDGGKVNEKYKRVVRGDINFKDLYHIIKTKYSGKLRDKMLAMVFYTVRQDEQGDSAPYLADAQQTIQNNDYKLVLSKYIERTEKAYPFELPDEFGKMHKLSDYAGKLLVVDFWYTGCPHCVELNSAMNIVTERYKNNKNIVFMSVSIDRDSHKWKESLSTEVYTSPDNVNLYTNGLGEAHPLPAYYGFTGYPQQLVIGKQGELITSSPPRPMVDPPDVGIRYVTINGKYNYPKEKVLSNKRTQDFIKLIDEHLND